MPVAARQSNVTRPIRSADRPVRIGFVPLADCAPLVVAHELDLFSKYGARVRLSRELGWATIRDKVIYGELEAAHAPAGILAAAGLGLGCVATECLTAHVMNLHSNAITLSEAFWKAGVRTAADLRPIIDKTAPDAPLTFGVAFRFSSHNYLLQHWLRLGGIDPTRDVRIVVVPPPQMLANLRAGNISGFCVGEPWNSTAVMARAGYVAATSAQLAPGHPEKVLMVRRDFAEQRAQDHLAIVAALIEACAYCDDAEHRKEIVQMLARREYVDAPAAAIARSLCGPFAFGHGRAEDDTDFAVFHRGGINEPTDAQWQWVTASLAASGVLPAGARDACAALKPFRSDLHQVAKQRVYENHKDHTKRRTVTA